MKKRLLLSLLLVMALPAPAEETKFKAEQIRGHHGKVCVRCDYVLQNGWVMQVIQDGEDWKLKPKEVLHILPMGMQHEPNHTQVYRVSPDYGKRVTNPPKATP